MVGKRVWKHVDDFVAEAQKRGYGTNEEMGALIEVRPSTFSQLRNHNYTGNVAGYAVECLRILAFWHELDRAPRDPDYQPTGAARRVRGALRKAHVQRVLAVICGPSGIGRTYAARQYCKETPQAVMVTATPGATSYDLLGDIADAIGIECRGTVHRRVRDISARLAGSARLIIVDEAGLLSESALHALRHVHDNARVGLVLLCTEAFFTRLDAAQGKGTLADQFRSRVTYKVSLGKLGREDIEMMLGGYRLAPEAASAARLGAAGNTRRLVRGMTAAQDLARGNGGRLTAEVVSAAFQQLCEVAG